MTEPRTIAGQAWLSGTRPFVRRALAKTILMIETETVAPYVDALLAADAILGTLAELDGSATWNTTVTGDLVKRAAAARRLVGPLLAPPS